MEPKPPQYVSDDMRKGLTEDLPSLRLRVCNMKCARSGCCVYDTATAPGAERLKQWLLNHYELF